MKKILLSFGILLLLSSGCRRDANKQDDKQEINVMLNEWHAAAAKAEFDNYFSFFTEDAVFMGTDATENWNKKDFMVWSKRFFDRGRAWSFTSLERNIYFDKTGKTAWFDELLDTQMKICRGSGVVTNVNGNWKIQQYVLSMTVPNDLSDSIVNIKASMEDSLIGKLKIK